MNRIWFFVIAMMMFLIGLVLTNTPSLSAPPSLVVDETGILNPRLKAELTNKIFDFYKKSGNQLVVVVKSSLEQQDIKEVTLKLGEEWKLGKNKQDNGVILLISLKENAARIEVGYGLEGSLTDMEAFHIINGKMKPWMLQKKLYPALNAGVDGIIEAISKGK